MERYKNCYHIKFKPEILSTLDPRPVWNPKAMVLPFHFILLVWDSLEDPR